MRRKKYEYIRVEKTKTKCFSYVQMMTNLPLQLSGILVMKISRQIAQFSN